MFEIAGVRLMRRAVSALCVISLAALLGACTHPSPPNSNEPKKWVVENVASKTTAELYADVIAPAVFERSGSQVIDGYTVESGNLRMLDKSMGSLVVVRSADGSLTAAVEKYGKSGWLVINSKGEGRFLSNPPVDYSLPDTIVDKAKTEGAKSSGQAGPYVIDMFIGFTRKAVQAGGGDATANALALVESVNLALRNSLVNNVSMRLVGIQVIEQNYPVTGATLQRTEALFAEGIRKFDPDMIYGAFGGDPADTAGGLAWTTYRTSIGHNNYAVFRHEVGHNASGGDCYVPGSSYRHGMDNGKTQTIQCGNSAPYYSTPAVRDSYGLPIGDAATADMARAWRENAERLSSYSKSISPAMNFRKTGSTLTTVTFGWDPSSEAVRYDVYATILSGSEIRKVKEVKGLTYTVWDSFGRTIYFVKAVDANGKESVLSNGASR